MSNSTTEIVVSALTDYPELFSSDWFGTVDSSDLLNPTRPNTYRQDFLLLDIQPNQPLEITLNSEDSDGDPYLQLINAETGAVIDFDDDGAKSH